MDTVEGDGLSSFTSRYDIEDMEVGSTESFHGGTSNNGTNDGAIEDDGLSIRSFTSRYDIEDKEGGSTESFHGGTSNAGTNDGAGIQEATKMLQSDARVRLLRHLALMLLLLTGTLVSSAVYMSLMGSEQREFETRFADQSAHAGHAFRSELGGKLRAIDSLSVSITSYAGSRSSGWPNVTLPDFSHRAATTLSIGRSIAVALHPLVYRENMREWEEFSYQAQEWRREDLDFQIMYPKDGVQDHNMGHRYLFEENFSTATGNHVSKNVQNISKCIFRVNDGIPTKVEESDIMLPLWQHSPVHDDGLPWVNYDVRKQESNEDALAEVMQNEVAILGQLFDLSESFDGYDYDAIYEDFDDHKWTEVWNGTVNAGGDDTGYIPSVNHHSDMEGPAVNIWYPVFSDLSENRTVVAILSMTTRWDSFILQSLPPKPNGLIVVISNGCKQKFTFDITGGSVTYLGPEDYHEPEYEKYKKRVTMVAAESVSTGVPLSQDSCPYEVTIYPSAQMRSAFESNIPALFAIGVAAIFLFTIVVFIAYDYLVQRRQNTLARTAQKTDAIVSALFPKIVRDRLFDDDKTSSPNGIKQFTKQPASQSLYDRVDLAKKSAPIADLFTNTTVMFGDIAGFTAWSSSRQPSEVFILLETLYGAFDKIAREIQVFKVETIGDCYLAVTGLPNPQGDHHLRMVRFARQALQTMSVLTTEMEVTLGPGTRDLGFRIGLHSGPVTAGVLRGEKGRFQLFGDTVNTASRMESTGKQNQIQVSQATADLITASGKSHWMRKRDERVQAKGKGEVQTYWIKSKVSSTVKSADAHDDRRASCGSVIFEKVVGEGQESSHKKLIDWQVELLSRLLKQIVVRRNMRNEQKTQPQANLDTNKILPRDEITEKIVMPAFDPEMNKKSMDLDSVQLPAAVVSQLNDLVTTIALLYHDNSFHNYEHACHVTMSANKLLQRIVVPVSRGTKEHRKEAHDYTYGLTSDPLTQFAIVFSAIVHDLDHYGVSNQQLVKEKNRLATMYNDKSVAEQNSIDLAFKVLTSASYSELVSCICMDENEYKRFRQLVINSVMATDIFDKDLVAFRNNRWDKAFGDQDESQSPDLKATIVIEHIMQAADVAHTMQHWHVYQKWNEKLFGEMCQAYESGRGPEKDPALTWYKGELWFFDNYILPLAKKLDDCGVFGVSSDECLNYALENRKEWESKGQKVVEDMARRYKGKQGGDES